MVHEVEKRQGRVYPTQGNTLGPVQPLLKGGNPTKSPCFIPCAGTSQMRVFPALSTRHGLRDGDGERVGVGHPVHCSGTHLWAEQPA